VAFWKRKGKSKKSKKAAAKKSDQPADTGKAQKAKKKIKRSPPAPLEIKILAVQALEAGLSSGEVSELAGVSSTTICNWRKLHQDGGVEALFTKASRGVLREQHTALEERIIAYRKEHPKRGVRRVSDDLRRNEGLQVSPEKVRTVVNEAGLGNPPPPSRRRPPQVRRFERPFPNAMWQIDIFTFHLKRLYPVYLIGVIDDHSRYMVGWGLYRQQTADAVLEVVKGAIGQWGAPREILSDNGRQFAAWRGETRFQKTLKRQGIQHVRSAPHHPMTLGKIERFWRTIWEEFLEEAVFVSYADACYRLDHWMHYYNHQRTHRGIDGACPADRFYGLTDDVEQAVAMGCQENSLRLALGQEPQPPLYLMGQIGGTDVSVTRKGEDIEVKVGDAVHETIRLGSPYTIEEDGSSGRANEAGEVEGPERGGALPGSGDGADGRGRGERPVQVFRRQSPDAAPSDGQGAEGGDGVAETEEAWPQGDAGVRDAGCGAGGEERAAGGGAGPLEDEVRHLAGDAGYRTEDLPRGNAAWGAEKKTPEEPAEAEKAVEHEVSSSTWPGSEGGLEE